MSDTPAAGPGFGPVEAALLREVGGAAPSIANSQPWRFAVGTDRVDVWTDPERSLPAVDPDGRQRLISCGAAILSLRLAVAHLGFDPLLRLCPTPDDPEHVATVQRGVPGTATPEDRPDGRGPGAAPGRAVVSTAWRRRPRCRVATSASTRPSAQQSPGGRPRCAGRPS